MNHCGTPQGYLAHKAANTPACQYCKSAKAKADAGLLVIAPIKSKREAAQCGSNGGYAKHRRNGEAACASCREAANAYKRAIKAKARGERTSTRTPAKCGTPSGYSRHKRANEEPCQPCVEAQRARSAEYRKNAPKPPPRELMPCGTAAAYDRHLRNKETPCDPCRDAQRIKSREKRANYVAREGGPRPHAGRKPINHGTTAGRAQHIRRGEKACDPCRIAFNEYNKTYNTNRKSRRTA